MSLICVYVWYRTIPVVAEMRFFEGEFLDLVDGEDERVQITPVMSARHQFFKQYDEGPKPLSVAGTYNSRWVLKTDYDPESAVLPFRFEYRQLKAVTESGDEVASIASADPSKIVALPMRQPLPKRFSFEINMNELGSQRRTITIRYKPVGDPGKGLFIRTASGEKPIVMMEEIRPKRATGYVHRDVALMSPALIEALRLTTVHAAEADCKQFRITQASIDDLRDQLGAPELSVQVSAKAALENCGKCCVPAIAKVVQDVGSRLGRERSILIANLRELIATYETIGVAIPDTVYADFAVALSRSTHSAPALENFSKVSGKTFQSRPELHFYKGVSHAGERQYDKAVSEYSQSLQKTPQEGKQVGVIYSLATAYYKLAMELESKRNYAEAHTLFDNAVKEYDKLGGLLTSDQIAIRRRAYALEGLQRTAKRP